MVRCFLECSFWQHELDQKGSVHSQGGPRRSSLWGIAYKARGSQAVVVIPFHK